MDAKPITNNYTLIADDITPAQLAKLTARKSVAVDSETLGLNIKTDRLCLLQLSSGDGTAILVKFSADNHTAPHAAPNVKKLLTDAAVKKIFHYARFDIAVLYFYLGVMTDGIYCTKIASKILRANEPKHSLSNLAKDLLNITMDKEHQVSNWAADELSPAQLSYAASDVLYLHQIKEKLDKLGTPVDQALVTACHKFLPMRALLDLHGFADDDIFAHH
ncbi:MAG: hypothetical protein QM529_02905 [Hydrotalea sp.]|nr:hypothetical protein [Hydrotalea sp.]